MTTRYRPIQTLVANTAGLIEENEDGDFVHYSDYRDLVEEIRRAIKLLNHEYPISAKICLGVVLENKEEEEL